MRMGDVLKGGLAAMVLAALGSGCVPQSQYNRMVQMYHAKEQEANQLAMENEELRARGGGPDYSKIFYELFGTEGMTKVGPGVALGDLGFGAGRHELTARGKAALSNIAEQIRTKNAWAMVDGHTDADPIVKSRGKYTSNLHLSAMRAKAVAEHLASQGVPKSRIFVRAFGASAPRAPNTTRAGKARNRRVEIYALKQAPAMLRHSGSFSGGAPAALPLEK